VRRLLGALRPLAACLALAFVPPGDGWTTTSLPHARGVPAGVQVGDLAIVAGGGRSGDPSRLVELYDPTTDHLHAVSLPRGRSSPSVATVGGTLVVAGGYDSSGQRTSTADLLDGATGQWRTVQLSASWSADGETHVLQLGSKVLLASTASVDVLDVPSGRASLTQLSAERTAPALATVGTRVLFAGGTIKQAPFKYAPSDAVDIYDGATGAWTTAHLSQARSDIAVAVLGSRVLFAGGSADGGPSAVVDIYDADTGAWSTRHLSEPRTAVGAVMVGGTAIFAGGQNSAAVDLYTAARDEWRTAQLSAPRAVVGVAAGSRAVFATRGSGILTFEAANVVDVYDSATDAWSATQRGDTPVPDVGERLFLPRFNAEGSDVGGTLVAAGGQVVFAGGFIPVRHGGAGQYWTVVPSAEMDILDLAAGAWSTSHLSEPAYSPRALEAGGTLVFVGRNKTQIGSGPCTPCALGVDYSSVADIYNLTTRSWSAKPLSVPRVGTGTGVLSGQAVLAGGIAQTEDGAAVAQTIDVFDARTRHWQSEPIPGPPPEVSRAYESLYGGPMVVEPYAVGPTVLLFRGVPGELSAYDTRTGSWSTLQATGTDPSGRPSVVVVGTRAIINRQQIYDGQTGGLSPCDLPNPGLGPGLEFQGSIGSKAIFAGGFANGATLDLAGTLDLVTGAWTPGNLSVARMTIQSAVVGHQVILVGGWQNASLRDPTALSDAVDIYDDDTGQWTAGPSPDQPPGTFAGVVGTRAVFALPNALGIYDAATGAWTTVAAPVQLGTPVGVVAGKVVFVGGDAAVYDVAADEWTTAQVSVPRARGRPIRSVVAGSKLLITGEDIAWPSDPAQLINIYDAATGQWSTPLLSLPRKGQALVSMGNLILVAGGQAEADSDRVDVFDATAAAAR